MRLNEVPQATSDLARRVIQHPVSFLTAVGVVIAILGVAQLAVALIALKTEYFAVIGVLAATSGLVANIVDVRLADLGTRLYLEVPKGEPGGRRAILAAGLVLQAALGLIIFALGLIAMTVIAPRLVEQPVAPWWIVGTALAAGCQYVTAGVGVQLRLIGRFTASGWLRLGVGAAGVTAMITALAVRPSLDGYVAGQLMTAMIGLAASTVVLARHVRQVLGGSFLQMPPRAAFGAYLDATGFLMSGSLLGFAKSLTRTGDVLLVAALTSDLATGIYRIARQASDALFSLSEPVHQFYTPTIVAALSRGDQAGFRRVRIRLVLLGLAAALGVALGALLILDPLVEAFIPRHRPAVLPFAILGALIAVTVGVHGWLWPALVAHNRIAAFSWLTLAGGALQLVVMALLARAGRLDPATAAATAWLTATVTYGPFLAERLVRRFRQRGAVQTS